MIHWITNKIIKIAYNKRFSFLRDVKRDVTSYPNYEEVSKILVSEFFDPLRETLKHKRIRLNG